MSSSDAPRPAVTVVMPVHNGERFIGEAVTSILRQTVRDLELVVVDDHSTDGTRAVLGSLEDERIRLIDSRGRGEGAARNTGIEAARGEFIAWHDSDDVALPHRLQSLLAAVAGGAGFAHSDMLVVDERLAPLSYARTQMLPSSRVLPFLLRFGTPYNNPSSLLRREAIGDERFNPQIKIGVDTDFVRRIAPRHVGVHVPEPLVLYRRHDDQLTKTLTPEMLRDEIRELLTEGTERLLPEVYRAYPELPVAQAVADAMLGWHLARRGFNEQAVEAMTRAFGSADLDGVRPVLDALTALLKGQPVQAVVLLARCRRTAITLVLTAEAQRRLGNTRTAVELSHEALSEDPDCYDAVLGIRAVLAAT